MMKIRKIKAKMLKGVLAFGLALLLCSCGAAKPEPSAALPGGTLPEIGAQDVSGAESEKQTETAPPETTLPPQTLPETTEAPTEAPTAAPAETLPPETVPAPTETTAEETTAAPETTPAPTEEPTTAPPETVSPPGARVWMGDSRFVGIRDSADWDRKRDVFISGWGMGYKWMLETAFPEFEKLAAEQKIDICYWSLGANDITNDPSDYNLELAAKYVAELNAFMARHPGVTFYLLSYGPVGEEGMDPNNIPDCASYNRALRIFTDYVRDHTSMRYIDQGEYIERTGFRVYDGCHYNEETNKRAYAYVLAQSSQ